MFIRLLVFVNISLPGNFIWSFVNFLLLIPMTLSFKTGTTRTHDSSVDYTVIAAARTLLSELAGNEKPPSLPFLSSHHLSSHSSPLFILLTV